MKHVLSLLFLFLAIVTLPSEASAALKPDDDPTILEGLRDKGVDWLKDKAKEAGKSWIFDTGQSKTMHDILKAAEERANGEGKDKKGLCQYAVMGQASSILSDVNLKWSGQTAALVAFDTTVKMVGLATGFGAAAGEGNALNWLIEQYSDAAKDAGKDAAFDKIKQLFGGEEKPEFELFEKTGKKGDCNYELRAVWDIVHGTYRVYIHGDCHCAKVGQFGLEPSRLGEWWISFEGHVWLTLSDDKRTTSWSVGPVQTMDFDAQCGCSKRKLREAFRRVTKEETSTSGGGGTTTTPSGPPPLPPAGRKVCKECQGIQDEIDADTARLKEAHDEVQQLVEDFKSAQARLEAAKGKLQAVKTSPKDFTVTPEQVEKQIQDIEAELKKINKDNDRLYAEQVRLMAALRDLARQLEDCLKTKCPPGKPVNETPPPAISPENKKKGVSYEGNPFASHILDVHNAERSAVGAPPLRWNPQLAADASAWATELAHTGQLVHAPREGRGIERENLSEGNLWWTDDQMLGSWVAEKRYFHPGLFPNVCTGEWTQCAHYSQIIWPTTTDLGCGEASGSGHKWLVCRYSPGGNKDGKPVGMPYVPDRG
jgi:uncharacterized protein YkwD